MEVCLFDSGVATYENLVDLVGDKKEIFVQTPVNTLGN